MGEAKSTFVKFHWKPLLGVHSFVWDEAQTLAGSSGLALNAGLLTRLTAASYIIMLGAIATAHWRRGFFMNWLDSRKERDLSSPAGHGDEPCPRRYRRGKWSVDEMIARLFKEREMGQQQMMRKVAKNPR